MSLNYLFFLYSLFIFSGWACTLGYSWSRRLWPTSTFIIPWHWCYTFMLFCWFTWFLWKHCWEMDAWSKTFLSQYSNCARRKQKRFKVCIVASKYLPLGLFSFFCLIRKLVKWLERPPAKQWTQSLILDRVTDTFTNTGHKKANKKFNRKAMSCYIQKWNGVAFTLLHFVTLTVFLTYWFKLKFFFLIELLLWLTFFELASHCGNIWLLA